MKSNTLGINLPEGDVRFEFVDLQTDMDLRRRFASWFVSHVIMRLPGIAQKVPASGSFVEADSASTLSHGDGWAFRGGVVMNSDAGARIIELDDGTFTYVPRVKTLLSRFCVRFNDVMNCRKTLISSIVSMMTSFFACTLASVIIAPFVWPDAATVTISLIDSFVFTMCFAVLSIPFAIFILSSIEMIVRSIISVWILDRFAQIYVELTRTVGLAPKTALEVMRSVKGRTKTTYDITSSDVSITA